MDKNMNNRSFCFDMLIKDRLSLVDRKECGMEEADRVLVQRLARQDDPEAFSSVMRHYAAMVYSTCRRILRNDTLAEDATQETFFHFLKNAPRITGSLGGWLHQVATRRAVDLVRQSVARQHRENAYASNDIHDIHQADQWTEIEPLVDEVLEELPNEMRELLIAHYLDGQSLTQMAADRKLSQPTLSRRVAAALEELRKKLRARGVAVSLAGLDMMLANSTQAAPATLLLGMGKMVMVHAASSSLPLAGCLTTPLVSVSLKPALAAGLIGLAVVSGWVMVHRGRTSQDVSRSTMEASAQTPARSQELPDSVPNPQDEKIKYTPALVEKTDQTETNAPRPIMLAQNSGPWIGDSRTGRMPLPQFGSNGSPVRMMGGAGYGGGGGISMGGGGGMLGGATMGGGGSIGNGGRPGSSPSFRGGGFGFGASSSYGGGIIMGPNQIPVPISNNPGSSPMNFGMGQRVTNLPNQRSPAPPFRHPQAPSPFGPGRGYGGGFMGGGGGVSFSFGGGAGGGGSFGLQGGTPAGMTLYATNYGFRKSFYYDNGRNQEFHSYTSSTSTITIPAR